MFHQGRLAEARRLAEQELAAYEAIGSDEFQRGLGEDSEYPATRTAVALATGHLLAAEGNAGGALERLDSLIPELTADGLVSLALEARLARHRIAQEAGVGDSTAFRAFAAEASELGFELIARQARELLRIGMP